jgi:uncharacterized protein YdcH (DUF465 family)
MDKPTSEKDVIKTFPTNAGNPPVTSSGTFDYHAELTRLKERCGELEAENAKWVMWYNNLRKEKDEVDQEFRDEIKRLEAENERLSSIADEIVAILRSTKPIFRNQLNDLLTRYENLKK